MSSQLPSGWIAVKLDEVVDILDFERQPINLSVRTQRIKGKNNSALFPYYGATGQVGWIDEYRSNGERVLLGEDAAPFLEPDKDKAYLVNGKFWVNNHAHVLRGAVDLVNNNYLCHQLNNIDYHPFVSGSTRLKLTNTAMKQISIIIAPATEQTRIVEKLEELLSDLDAGVAELKTAQKKLEQYRQSLLKAAVEGNLTAEWRQHNTVKETGAQLLQRILTERRTHWEAKQLAKFKEQGKPPPKDWQKKYPEPVQPDTSNLPELPEGWVWSSIGQCFYVAVGATPSRKEPNYWNGNIPWVSSGEVNFTRITKTKEGITEAGLNNSSTQINPIGSVMLGMIGEGKTRGQVSILDIKAANNQNCAAIWVSKTEIPSEFVYFWLWSRYEKTRQNSSGNNQPALNKFIVENIPFPLPPLSEQRAILAQVCVSIDQIQNQEQLLETSFKQSAAQRKNILKAAFSGQLVPQDPNDEPASLLLERIRAEREKRDAIAKPRKSKTRKI